VRVKNVIQTYVNVMAVKILSTACYRKKRNELSFNCESKIIYSKTEVY